MEPVEAGPVKAGPVKAAEPVVAVVKAAEPVKRLIGFSRSVKQVTTDVHSFELFLSTEIYDFLAEKLGFFMSSTLERRSLKKLTVFLKGTTKLRVYAGPTYGDQDAIACAKNL